MTVSHFQAPDAPGFKLDPRVVGAFGRFAGGFWQGATAFRAWSLTLGLAAFLILSTTATVALNQWNCWFFDSLENRDVAGLTHAVFVFGAIIAVMAAIGVGIVLARETLQVRWRAWIVEQLVERWLSRQRFYHLNVTGKEPPNPEYRISDDTRWATEPLVDLGIGLVLAVVGAAAFISILWTVGGSYTLVLPSLGSVTIPAYMVIVALGLRFPRLRPDAVGGRAAGRLRRPQERGRGLLPLRHDAHPRQRRERRPHERRPLRAGRARPLLRDGGGALDGDRVAARAPHVDHQRVGAR